MKNPFSKLNIPGFLTKYMFGEGDKGDEVKHPQTT
jgi:hypothetical protein